ncbi:hypothetical protein EBZ80_18335 [bacterium]|nr:hypothetical protein [Betaproteobacteria bacterium]NDE16886.1 hypothetical protein [bacterium]
MTAPGVITIPQKTAPPENPPMVIAAGPPKSVGPHTVGGELVVVHQNGVATGRRVTIDGVTIMTAVDGVMTTGQVTIHP